MEAHTEQAHRGCVGCLAEVGPSVATKAKRSSSALKRTESFHCCRGVGEVGRLASPVSECLQKCGGEEDLATACLTMGAEVEFAWVVEELVVVAAVVEQSLVACWTKASMPGRCSLSSRTDEVIPEDAPGLHCGMILAVRPLGVTAVGTHRKAFDLATPAYLTPEPCCRRSSFVCCTASPGPRPALSILPCAERCPVSWRKHRDAQGCRDPALG